MKNIYCDACGQSTLPNMRICPQCGGRNFSSAANESPRNNESSVSQSLHTAPVTQNSYQTSLKSFGYPAKHFPRLIAAIIDSVLSQGAVYIFALALSAVTTSNSVESTTALNFILGFVISILYFSLQHSSKSQATVGKRLMGIKLVTDAGQRVSLGLAVLRIMLPSIILISGSVIFALFATPMVLLAEGAPELQISAASTFIVIYLVLIFVPLLMVFGNYSHKTLFDFICKTRVIEAAHDR